MEQCKISAADKATPALLRDGHGSLAESGIITILSIRTWRESEWAVTLHQEQEGNSKKLFLSCSPLKLYLASAGLKAGGFESVPAAACSGAQFHCSSPSDMFVLLFTVQQPELYLSGQIKGIR